MTVHQYVRERNLTTAKQLLLSSEYSVGEISDRLGYCDDNYFSAVFKKHFGLSPMQFRLQNRAVKKCNTQESPEQRQG
jgi:two-component system response regulator YesN